MSQLVFVPLAHAQAQSLRELGSSPGELVGYAATASLLASHDFDASTLEDADYAALAYAGIEAVLGSAPAASRLVLAVDVSPAQVAPVSGHPYGQVHVHGLRWRDVTALFADEASAAPAVDAARAAGAGVALSSALDHPDVERLLNEHDLLWFAPDELDRLT